jgi:ABC-2 type transport system permease protein
MMFLLMFKQFIRSRAVIVALALFFAIGLVSILVGKQFLRQQEAAIASVTQLQQVHIERNVRYIQDDMGLLLYYLRFAYINQPNPLAALATGQQDVNPAIQFLTIRGLEAQRYDTDFNNPLQLLVGHLDLSFVILFLMPLLIISCCFNLLSQEKESGTWAMVRAQRKKPWGLLLQKIGVRYMVVLTLLAVLLGLAWALLGLPLGRAFGTYALLSGLYVSFWFAVCFLVAALHKGSSTNALLLLGVWMGLCLMLPALANNYITATYTVPEAYNNLVLQRDGYHTKWDKPKDSTLKAFFRRYPQFEGKVWERPSFDYLWYYAMQQAGDDEAATATGAMLGQIRQRLRVSSAMAQWVPSLHAQLQYAQLAQTGLADHLAFLDSTARFHERKKLYFYQKIFNHTPIAAEKWERQLPEYFTPRHNPGTWAACWPALLYTVLLVALGCRLFAKKNSL